MAKLTDSEIMEYAQGLYEINRKRMGLEEWHTSLHLRDEGPMGETWYDEHKRESIIYLRRDTAQANSGEIIPYVMAHEMAHLMMADLCYIGDVGPAAIMSEAMAHTHSKLWLNAEERLVHQIAYLMGTTTPPGLWAGPVRGTVAALGPDAS